MKARIFISYRREDNAGHAGRLAQALHEHYGQADVFLDLLQIRTGTEFRNEIRDAVKGASLLILLMGRRFTALDPETGKSRLHNPRDVVGLEVKTAFDQGVAILPVCIQGAKVPTRDQLPRPMKRLVDLDILEVADRDWNAKLELLMQRIDGIFAERFRISRIKAESLRRLKRLWTQEADPDARIVFSPDSRLLVSSTHEGVARLSFARSGETAGSFKVAAAPLWGFAFSVDGRSLAIGAEDGISIWDCIGSTLKHAQTLALEAEPFSMAFSPSGSLFASGHNGRAVCLWSLPEWECTRKLVPSWIATAWKGDIGWPVRLAFNTRGDLIAAAMEDEVQIRRTSDGELVQTLRGHHEQVMTVAFSPADKNLLVSASKDHSVRLWDISTGMAFGEVDEHEAEVISVAFSPDGSLVASGGWDGAICLSQPDGTLVHKLTDAGSVTDVAFSPDGGLLAALREDGGVEVWAPEAAEANRTNA